MKATKKSKRKPFIIISILALVIVSVIAIQSLNTAKAASAVKTSENVKTITVGTQDIEKIVSGTSQIITGDEETLTLEQYYKVDQIKVTAGQAVKKGTVLLTYTNGAELTAPVNGVIKTISASEGATARNSTAPAFVLMSTDNLITELSVDETDLESLKVDQVAGITVNALPKVKYTGKVTKISETGAYQNGSSTFTVTITLDKTTNVKIGMSADVKIVVASAKDAVAVPIEAVMGSGNNAKVMVVGNDGTVTPVFVKLGLANDAYVQITSGLSKGDTVQYTVQSTSSSTNRFMGMQGFGTTNRSGFSGNGSESFSRNATDKSGSQKSSNAG
ncbi:MAG: HlyD family efflux transporter periplasmic adaptor subunit [Clostridiales bacterium]|nr:HlyD family efflux transporter periplasmic adaptor subunit [Clostridiales bacterium]